MKEYPTAWTVFQPAKELTRVIVVIGRDFYAGSQGDTLAIQVTLQTKINSNNFHKRFFRFSKMFRIKN